MHHMIDLETLSTASDATITQIGVVPFMPGEDYLRAGMGINVDAQSCVDLGLRVDWSTVYWWMRQDDAARGSLSLHGSSLSDALLMLSDFIGPEDSVWSNGAAFDIPILENAYRACGMKVPWRFNRVLDVRTMKLLAPEVGRVQPGVAHNALSDAEAQALWVQRMWRALKR